MSQHDLPEVKPDLMVKTWVFVIAARGPLAIYAFDDPAAALAFAQAFRAELARNGIICRIGVESGPVLVFDLPLGGSDIAGNPVNIASKMAQDAHGHWACR